MSLNASCHRVHTAMLDRVHGPWTATELADARRDAPSLEAAITGHQLQLVLVDHNQSSRRAPQQAARVIPGTAWVPGSRMLLVDAGRAPAALDGRRARPVAGATAQAGVAGQARYL